MPFDPNLRNFGLAFLLILPFSLFTTGPVFAKTVDVTLLLLCDIYEMKESNGRGGFARIASVVRAERARAKNVFVAHAGDAISPSLMSGFDRGEHIIDLLNVIGLDAFVPGNHEYDFGADIFKKRMGEAKFPLYAANLRDENNKILKGFRDGKMLTFEGVKIGIFGLTDENSPSKSDPGDLKFSKVIATAKRMSKGLRVRGADLVVAITHTGREHDEALLELGELDVLLSGDDHDLVISYDGNAVFAESKQDGEYIVAVDLKIKVWGKADKRRVSWWPNFRILDTAKVRPDADVAARVASYQKLLTKELDVPLGTVSTSLDSRSASVRSRETAMGNLVADAMRTSVGADIAIINGGGIRGNKVYPAGHVVTRKDVLTELPFLNLTMMFEMTGAQIRHALENGLSSAEGEFGKFPQVSGLLLTASLKRKPGQRITAISVGGKKLDDKARYKVATNDYLARGREGYTAFREAKQLIGKIDARLVANDVMVFIRKKGKLAPKTEGRIKIER